MNNIVSKALIDTGASVSLISEKLVIPQLQSLNKFKGDVKDANGNSIAIKGQLKVKLKTPEGEIKDRLLIFENNGKLSVDVILGMNILEKSSINFSNRKISFRNDNYREENSNIDNTCEIRGDCE